jgi:sulfatase modifying factor 1
MKRTPGRFFVTAILLVAAVVAILIAVRNRPGEKERLYAAGETALAARRWDEARASFEALAARDPAYRDVTDKLDAIPCLAGAAYLEAGEYERAIVELQRALPTCRDAEDKLAQALDRDVVYVPAGEFIMGSDAADVDERPQRRVYLDAFEIDRYEVTNVQYRRFLLATGRKGPQHWPERYEHLVPDRDADWQGDVYPAGEATYPVVGAGWPEAAAYCEWAGKRLPTEAEWEKAARGTDGRAYPWGNTWDASKANTREAGVGYTQPVGTYPAGASPYGVMDAAGNVGEWIADWYDRLYYSYAPDRNPPGPSPAGERILTGERIQRGGAWDSPSDHARTSYRNATHFFGPNVRVGFRCVRSVLP